MRVDVISVATPQGLFRAICPTFSGQNCMDMVNALVECIGRVNLQDTEWRGAIYVMPDYLRPRKRYEYPLSGVFLYPWVTRNQKSALNPHAMLEKHDQESVWNDPRKRYTIPSHRTFIMRPRGWIHGSDSSTI